ncbi:hypothetical protein [Cellulomonas sp. HD19AZ1]|uniref:hypothetical protein n=1 Tax=Cellulomonas TaxID=1707 RepID=UPI00107071EE|nr:hypothetical protein [Cellulomonas sp. HD19AZ1]TFH72120.1 hypothetical protein E4A51_08380 [Cellulomonas sp. HD19AZ1]
MDVNRVLPEGARQAALSDGTATSGVTTWRVIQYCARNGLVLWAALATIAAEMSVALQRGMQWRGDLIWTVDWVPVSFIIVGPVVAGLAAIDTASSARGASHLFARPVTRTPAFAITLAYGTVVGAAHLAVLGVALIVSDPPVWDPWVGVAVLVQLAMLTLFATIGTTLGRFVGVVMAGVLAALSVFGLLFVASAPGDGPALLEFGGATLPRIGYAYSPIFLSSQLVLLSTAIAALLLLRPVDPIHKPRPSRSDLVAAGAALVAVAVGSAYLPGQRLVAVEASPTLCGAVQTVPTCFYPQHRRVMPVFQEQFWVLVSAARENGYEDLVPRRLAEASRTELPQEARDGTAAVYVMPEHLQGRAPSLWEIASGIVQPVHCAQVKGELPPSERYWQDLQALVVTWVSLADPDVVEAVAHEGELLTPHQASVMAEEFAQCTYAHF